MSSSILESLQLILFLKVSVSSLRVMQRHKVQVALNSQHRPCAGRGTNTTLFWQLLCSAKILSLGF